MEGCPPRGGALGGRESCDGWGVGAVINYLLVALSAVAASFLLALVLWQLGVRYSWHREIRPRDVHQEPTPRLGGIAVYVGIVLATLVASQLPQFDEVFANPRPIIAVLVAGFIVVTLGVIDDLIDLDWLTKLSGQFIAAGVVAWQGVQIVSLPIGGITLFSPTLSLVLTVLAIVLVMNAVNFIDGLDGLAAGVALISNAVFFLYALVLSLGEVALPTLASRRCWRCCWQALCWGSCPSIGTQPSSSWGTQVLCWWVSSCR